MGKARYTLHLRHSLETKDPAVTHIWAQPERAFCPPPPYSKHVHIPSAPPPNYILTPATSHCVHLSLGYQSGLLPVRSHPLTTENTPNAPSVLCVKSMFILRPAVIWPLPTSQTSSLTTVFHFFFHFIIPQGLCTHHSFCLELPPPPGFQWLPSMAQTQVKSYLLREASFDHTIFFFKCKLRA